MTDIKAEIAVELVEALRACGAKADLLQPIGDYRDTMSDEDVLDHLRRRNDAMGLASRRADEPLSTEAAIREEIRIGASELGAPIQLIGIIGSWGDTYGDQDTLDDLRRWNGKG